MHSSVARVKAFEEGDHSAPGSSYPNRPALNSPLRKIRKIESSQDDLSCLNNPESTRTGGKDSGRGSKQTALSRFRDQSQRRRRRSQDSPGSNADSTEVRRKSFGDDTTDGAQGVDFFIGPLEMSEKEQSINDIDLSCDEEKDSSRKSSTDPDKEESRSESHSPGWFHSAKKKLQEFGEYIHKNDAKKSPEHSFVVPTSPVKAKKKISMSRSSPIKTVLSLEKPASGNLKEDVVPTKSDGAMANSMEKIINSGENAADGKKFEMIKANSNATQRGVNDSIARGFMPIEGMHRLSQLSKEQRSPSALSFTSQDNANHEVEEILLTAEDLNKNNNNDNKLKQLKNEPNHKGPEMYGSSTAVCNQCVHWSNPNSCTHNQLYRSGYAGSPCLNDIPVTGYNDVFGVDAAGNSNINCNNSQRDLDSPMHRTASSPSLQYTQRISAPRPMVPPFHHRQQTFYAR